MRKLLLVLLLSAPAFAQHIKATTADITNLNLPYSVTVESFGAVGDWNGSSGTDNTAAIQACLNSLTDGVCTLQAKSYKISAPLTISKSSVGLVGVNMANQEAVDFTTSPPASVIITTNSSADILDVAGSNPTTGNIGFNYFANFVLARSVTPSGIARGFSLMNSYGVTLDHIYVSDSMQAFYFKGVGAGGVGAIKNCEAAWGYNGVTETSGTLYGFFVDSAGGVQNPSIRFQNDTVANKLGHSAGLAWTTYGFVATGTYPADWHLIHPEVANTDYGIYLNTTGTLFQNLDIQVLDPIIQVYTTAIFVQGLAGPYSSFTVTGGLSSLSSVAGAAAPTIDIESSNNVKIMNHTVFYDLASSVGLYAHNSFAIQSSGNTFLPGNGAAPAIQYDTVVGGVISGNQVIGVTANTLISVLASTYLTIYGNSMTNDTATTGLSLNGTSHFITGLDSQTCSAGVTNCIADSGNNAAIFNQVLVNPIAVAGLPACNAAAEGTLRPVNNANSAVFNAAVAAGGANHIIAYCNGSGWVIH
jgi:hypothetical protein